MTYQLNAGKLDQFVTIETDTGSNVDATGQHVEVWIDYLPNGVWAEIKPLTGRELWNALQVQPDVTHQVTIRYREGITSKMRIKHGSRYLNILSAIDVEEKRTSLQIMCKESV
jgi:SPP1 family predicted phage head-tail adaptor